MSKKKRNKTSAKSKDLGYFDNMEFVDSNIDIKYFEFEMIEPDINIPEFEFEVIDTDIKFPEFEFEILDMKINDICSTWDVIIQEP